MQNVNNVLFISLLFYPAVIEICDDLNLKSYKKLYLIISVPSWDE